MRSLFQMNQSQLVICLHSECTTTIISELKVKVKQKDSMASIQKREVW